MAQGWCGAVDSVGMACLVLAVVGTSLCETVGHEHVKDIGIGESLACVARHLALPQWVADGLALLA